MVIDGIRELFEPSGPVQIRRMFGAHGIFRDGRMIALEDGGMIWLKADDVSQVDFVAAGSRPFEYEKKSGSITVMSYWLLPEAAHNDPDVMRDWVILAERAAQRTATATAISARKLAGSRVKATKSKTIAKP